MYDHPFQWGSKRTGPDLARVGGKYSDQWHAEHMINPRAVVPESIMPGYPWLAAQKLDTADIEARMKTLRVLGVPYTDEMIANAAKDMKAQIEPDTRAARRPHSSAIPRPAPPSSTAIQEPSRASSMRSSPTCRSSARWSTSPPSMPPGRT